MPYTPDEFDQTLLSLEQGDVLSDRYRLVRELGRGGMGVVWLAEDEQLDDRPVAIKVLPSALCRNARAVARLKKEALTNLELTHPHIVRLHTFEQDPQRSAVAYLVMQYVEGKTLDDLLAEHPDGLPLERVQKWAEQLAQAIDHSHARQILHRDIKPSNIIIDGDDNAYLMDFGIAREAKDTMTRVTGRDSSGTLPYMSPQQLMGKNNRSNDIYSFAATLYEALCGRPPFETGDIASQIRLAQPEAISNLPDEMNTMLLKGLAKEPEDRYATCADMVSLRVAEKVIPTNSSAVLKTPAIPPAVSETPATSTAVPRTPEVTAVVPKVIPVETNHDSRRTIDLGEDIKMNFVFISPGEFTMGSPADEIGPFGDESPQRQVTISRGFWLAETPTTQSQWLRVMENNPSRFTGDLNRPVEMISWNDAKKFAEQLTERMRKQGVIDGNQRFGLPTEAQWEYACRAGTTTRYSFGNNENQLADHAWFCSNSNQSTQPVRQLKPNPWGLFDMHGNVWEWCEDCFGEYKADSVTDPTGPNEGMYRVLRGGSWFLDLLFLRSACRHGGAPVICSNDVGVRLILDTD